MEEIPSNEKWLPTKELGELYQVSNLGRVRRDWHGTWKYIGMRNSNGYKSVVLSRSGIPRRKSVHHLVMESFKNIDFDTLPDGVVVHHKDEDPSNNRPENLELTTHAQNMRYSGKARNAKWREDTLIRLGWDRQESKAPKAPGIESLSQEQAKDILAELPGAEAACALAELQQKFQSKVQVGNNGRR